MSEDEKPLNITLSQIIKLWSLVSMVFGLGVWVATLQLKVNSIDGEFAKRDTEITKIDIELVKRGEWMKTQGEATVRMEERQKAMFETLTKIEGKIDK